MHDCRVTTEKLLDLAVNETAGPGKFVLLAELQDCADCRDEYHSVKETLRAFDRAGRAVAPPEIYWEGYQGKLRQQLRALEVAPEPAPVVAWWRRLLTASIRVPVPMAAAVCALVIVGGAWAMRLANRPSATPVVINAPAAPLAQPTPEKVFVTNTVTVAAPPQIVERVITRNVYLPARETPRNARVGTAPRAPGNGFTPLTNATEATALAGFQPPGKVELRVIKSDAQQEK